MPTIQIHQLPECRRRAQPVRADRTLPAIDDVTRRDLLKGAAALLVAAGCGTDRQPVAAPSPTASIRTIEHRYGSTAIVGVPERVVTVGLTDHDTVLALGVTPLGVYDWYGEYPYATHPWAQDELGDARPAIVGSGGELDFEAIAALRPDLILGVNSAMTAEEHETLSAIAPTVAQSDTYEWDVMAEVIGRALNRQERADERIAEVEALFAEARRDHPEFVGATAVFAYGGEDGVFYAATDQTPRAQILTELGFDLRPETERLAVEDTIAEISGEQLELFDHDLILWDASPAVIDNNPLYQRLDVAREGRDVFLEDPVLSSAVVFATVLSLLAVIEELVPRLAEAIDGDPATQASS